MWVVELGCLPHSLAAALPVTSVARFPSLYNRVDCDSLTELLWNVTKWMNNCDMRHWDHWWANNIREILAVINTSAVISTIALRYYCWMLVLPVIGWCLPAAPSDLSGPAVALWEGTSPPPLLTVAMGTLTWSPDLAVHLRSILPRYQLALQWWVRPSSSSSSQCSGAKISILLPSYP